MTQFPEPDHFDEDLSRRLSGLAGGAAGYTSDVAQPLPAESVRRLGTQRRHRRVGGVAVATLACLIMAGGAAIGVTRLDSDQPLPVASPGSPTVAGPTSTPSTSSGPSPSASPSSSASSPSPSTPDRSPSRPGSGSTTGTGPGARLDTGLLATATELAWQDFGDFAVTGTSQGQGDLPARACVQPLTGLGADAIGRRDYAVSDRTTTRATEWVLQLGSTAAAQQAYTTATGWGTACSSGAAHRVTVSQGTAVFTETSTPASRGNATFVSYGVTRVGDRLAIVLLTDVSTESHWAYSTDDNTGLPLHPLIRSLPLVAARLAGTPGSTAGSTPPTSAPKACQGGPSGLQVDVAVVPGSAGAGHLSYRITVINTTKAVCTIQGFAGVQFADDAGKKIGADATRSGATGPTVTLEPQQSTTAIIRLSQAGAYGTACDVRDANAFRIFLPGMTEPSYAYSPDMKACASTAVQQLTVTAFGTG